MSIRYVDEVQDILLIDALCNFHSSECIPRSEFFQFQCFGVYARTQMAFSGLETRPKLSHSGAPSVSTI